MGIFLALKRLHEYDSCYEALHYVLMFPRGSPGWSLELKQEKEVRFI